MVCLVLCFLEQFMKIEPFELINFSIEMLLRLADFSSIRSMRAGPPIYQGRRQNLGAFSFSLNPEAASQKRFDGN